MVGLLKNNEKSGLNQIKSFKKCDLNQVQIINQVVGYNVLFTSYYF